MQLDPAKAARKSRTGGASATWASNSSSGMRRSAVITSRRLVVTISSRIDPGMVAPIYECMLRTCEYVIEDTPHRQTYREISRIAAIICYRQEFVGLSTCELVSTHLDSSPKPKKDTTRLAPKALLYSLGALSHVETARC